MSRHFSTLAALAALCLLQVATVAHAQAPSVTNHIPSDVRGFAVLKNVEKTLGKVETLAARFQAPIPPLSEMLGNFDEGLNKQGDLGVAWLDARAGDDDQSGYMHFVAYLPVTDYKAFLEQFHPADADAKIAAISFNDQEFSLAQKGDYAIVADVDDTASIEHVLAAEASVAETARPIAPWIHQNDLTVSLTPKGTQLMFTKLKEGLAMIKSVATESAGENAQMIESALGLYESLFEWSEKECEQVAIGIRVDTENSISLHKRVVLSADGSLAGGSDGLKSPESPLADMPGGPFVFAFEGAMPDQWPKDWMAMSFNMLNNMRGADSEALSAEEIEKLSESAARMMKGMKSMAFVMGVGEADDGIYGRTVGVMRVANAQAFLQNYSKAFVEMTALMKGSVWADAYTIRDIEFEGKPAIHLTMDMSKFQFAGAEVAEAMAEYYDKMFGKDGKLAVYLTTANDSTVVMAYSSMENLKRAVNVASNQSLAGDTQIKKTAEMLPPGAQWIGYISPGGIIEFASNMMGTFAPGATWDLGEFPASPPLGFAVELAPTYLDGHLVVPLETVDAIKEFVEQMQD